MSDASTRQERRQSAICSLLPLVPSEGWTLRALEQAAGPSAAMLFPGGQAELVEAYIDMADREMCAAAAPVLVAQKLSQRVRTLLAVRFEQAAPHKEAVRRAAAVLARPSNAGLAARCTARTVDRIWHAAGDTAADFSWYTKRAILAGAYTSTFLFWLADGNDEAETLAFLDRRLAEIAAFGRFRRRLSERFAA